MAEERVGDFVTGKVRLHHPNVFEARAFMQNGKPVGDAKYSVVMLIEDDDEVRTLKEKARRVAKTKWPKIDLADVGFPFKDGDKEADRLLKKPKNNGKERSEQDVAPYRGTVVLKADTLYEPQIVGPDKQPVLDTKQVYPGVEAYVAGTFVAYDHPQTGEPHVKAYFSMLLTTGKGERFAGGARSARDVFAGIRGSVSDENPLSDDDDDIPF